MAKGKSSKMKAVNESADTESTGTDAVDATDELKKLKAELKKREEQILHLESIITAHDRLDELSRQELIDADATIKAQETLQELIQRERVEADKTIEAQENLAALTQQEKLDAEETIRAQERLLHLSDMEKKQAAETIRAHESLEELVRREREESDRFFQASREVSDLTVQELRKRDDVLRHFLTLNRSLSGIMDEELMFENCLSGIGDILGADYGAVYYVQGGRPLPAFFWKTSEDRMEAPDHSDAIQMLCRTAAEQKPDCLCTDEKAAVALPLLHNGCISGVLYLCKTGDGASFSRFEMEVLELLASQAAIYRNNGSLLRRVKEQNGELLRLINLKNNVITHISGDLVPQLDRLCGEGDADGPLCRVRNTMLKALTIINLEAEVEELFRDRINFREMLDGIVAQHSRTSEKKGITINMELPASGIPYTGNKVLIHTIFDELYSNAVFYNKEDGSVTVSGEVTGDRVMLSFTDTGVGIAPDEQQKIFEQFYRMESTDGFNDAGAGLGLFMVRSLVDGYGGEVSVRSAPGQGSTFTVSFLLHD